MPTDGQHCAAGEARLEVWQVLLNESCGITCPGLTLLFFYSITKGTLKSSFMV